MSHEPNDQCGLDENDHSYVLNITFYVHQNEDGENVTTAAEVNSHVHNAPVQGVAQTLITMAATLLEEEMAHSEAFSSMPHALAHAAAKAMTRMYIMSLLEKLPETEDMSAFTVPDDLSGLGD